jgi:hypothetical protein
MAKDNREQRTLYNSPYKKDDIKKPDLLRRLVDGQELKKPRIDLGRAFDELRIELTIEKIRKLDQGQKELEKRFPDVPRGSILSVMVLEGLEQGTVVQLSAYPDGVERFKYGMILDGNLSFIDFTHAHVEDAAERKGPFYAFVRKPSSIAPVRSGPLAHYLKPYKAIEEFIEESKKNRE